MVLDTDWHATEKKTDPDFAGSIWEEMGYEDKLCPTCEAHLHGGICLNACHLSRQSRERLADLMQAASRRSAKGVA